MTHTEAARALFAKAGDGDEAAIAIVREVARYVGYGCVTIFNGYNPEHIIIGDIVSEAGPILLDEVRATVAERAIPKSMPPLPSAYPPCPPTRRSPVPQQWQ